MGLLYLRSAAMLQVACEIKAAVHRELALTMSFGIAVGKLAARLAGPLHKPSGMTIVPPSHAAAFLLDTPILRIPHLRCDSRQSMITTTHGFLCVDNVSPSNALKLIQIERLCCWSVEYGSGIGTHVFGTHVTASSAIACSACALPLSQSCCICA